MKLDSEVANSLLGNLTSVERADAIKMLIHLGLFFYLKDTQSTHINMNELRELCNTFRPSARKAGVPKQPQPPPSLHDRKGRSDSMAHFPFKDSYGSIDTVLRPSESSNQFSHRILRITSPARRRWAHQVYEEMCIGRARMRLEDVPEALLMLGLTVTPELSRALVRSSRSRRGDGGNTVPVDATIDAVQWYAIVKRCVKREVVLTTAGIIADGEQKAERRQQQHEEEEEEEREGQGQRGQVDDFDDSLSIQTPPSLLEGIVDNNNNYDRRRAALGRGGDDHNVSGNESCSSSGGGGGGRGSGRGSARVAHKQAREEARHQQRELIRRDRKSYTVDKSRKEAAALATVGGRRVGSLAAQSHLGTATGTGTGARSSNQQWGSASSSRANYRSNSAGAPTGTATATGSGSSTTAWRQPMFATSRARDADGFAVKLAQAQSVANRHKKISLGRWADLDSGTATMEIAESFLQGPIGRELSDPSSYMYNRTGVGMGARRGGGGGEEEDGDDEAMLDVRRSSRSLVDMEGDEYERDVASIGRVVDSIVDNNGRESDSAMLAQASYILGGNRNTRTGASSGSGSGSGGMRSQQFTNFSQGSGAMGGGGGGTGGGGGVGAGAGAGAGAGFRGGEHKTIREREAEQARVRESRSLYSQGWRSAKGGWVADFGAPHTHSLNREDDLELYLQPANSVAEMRESFYRHRHEQKLRSLSGGPYVEGVGEEAMRQANVDMKLTTGDASLAHAASRDRGRGSRGGDRDEEEGEEDVEEDYEEEQFSRRRGFSASSATRTTSTATTTASAPVTGVEAEAEGVATSRRLTSLANETIRDSRRR